MSYKTLIRLVYTYIIGLHFFSLNFLNVIHHDDNINTLSVSNGLFSSDLIQIIFGDRNMHFTIKLINIIPNAGPGFTIVTLLSDIINYEFAANNIISG